MMSAGLQLLALVAGNVRYYAPSELNPVVVTRFESANPVEGEVVMRLLNFRLVSTLRVPRAGADRKTAFWDENAIPKSSAEAVRTTRTDKVQMSIWGKAWDYCPGVAIQAYLTIRDDLADPDAGWTVAVPLRHGGEAHVSAPMPAFQYEFKPLVLRGLPCGPKGAAAIPFYDQKYSRVSSGYLTGGFTMLENGEWSKIRLKNRKVKWLHLPGYGSDRSDVVEFTAAIIRLLRADWVGALEMFGRVAKDTDVRSDLRVDSYLLMAVAADHVAALEPRKMLEFVDEAKRLAPLSATVVKYACLANLSAFSRAHGRGDGNEESYLELVIALLNTNNNLFSPDDKWIGQVRDVVRDAHRQKAAAAAAAAAAAPR
jgi:hypothetical protein